MFNIGDIVHVDRHYGIIKNIGNNGYGSWAAILFFNDAYNNLKLSYYFHQMSKVTK